MALNRWYRPELDALRFLAFMLVFACHTCASIAGQMHEVGPVHGWIADISFAGAWGVDLFFLLSAYLITTLFINEEQDTGRIDVPAFYVRRVLRIWPLYFAFLAFCFALQFVPLIIYSAARTEFTLQALVAFVFLYGNWYMVFAGTFTSPVTILWSISIEEQFYALWPLAMQRFPRQSLIVIGGILFAIAWVTRYMLLSAGVQHYAVWCNTLARLDPIAAGIIVAIVLEGRVPSFSHLARAILLGMGLSALIVGSVVFRGPLDGPKTLLDGMVAYPLATIGASMIFLAFLGATVTFRPIIYLGRISFGLYVFHLFWLDIAKVLLTRELGDCPFWARALIALPLTVGTAALSYPVEKWFMAQKRRFSRGARSSGVAKSQAAVPIAE